MTNITPELDANGNPVAQGGDESITLTKAEYDAMTLRLATLAQSTDSTVEELKEQRRINAELKAKDGNQGAAEPNQVQEEVQKVLAEEKAKQAKANYESAVTEFLAAHQEFSTENDPGGVKFTAFQKAVSRINLNGLQTEQDFQDALSDAYGLMERKQSPVPVDISSSPRSGGIAPRVQINANLMPEENKLVQRYFSGDTAAYLKARDKRPTYYEELLRYVR